MKKENSRLFLLILLGMLTAFGPFVTDMYLPSLPSMSASFHTNSSMVQLGLTTSMLGLAFGQLCFGPLSDKYGRRTPLLVAMGLFILSTVLCIYAQTIGQFIALRFIQGIAGSGGIVISRSVATDKFTGRELAKMLAVIGAINGIAPVTAPIIGGAVTDSIGWKGIFCLLLILGFILLAGCIRLKESLNVESRKEMNLVGMLRNFGVVLRNRRYLGYVLQLGFAQGILFANISSSPFIMQQHYGLSPFMFSLCFGINSISIGSSAAFSVKFHRSENCTFTGCVGMLVVSLVEFAALCCNCGFWIYESLLLLLLFMMGMTFTSSTTLAMDCERTNSGTASALLGTICFMFGGFVSPLVSIGNILTTTGAIFVICSVCSLLSIDAVMPHPHLQFFRFLNRGFVYIRATINNRHTF
jgi:DHA1 family bicyclomycin/chloramphenicol resistance-like MFS transporter